MKKYLLPEKGVFYKANLHCHSNCSDGTKTPKALIKMYRDNGYSVVALTDTEKLFDADLCEDSFVLLRGMEIEFTESVEEFEDARACHLCFLAPEEKMYLDMPANRTYDAQFINTMIATARKQGAFITYNHPTWSQEYYSEYICYDGLHAIEMFNGHSDTLGYEEYNPRVYDDFLTSGKKVFCVGVDGNYNIAPECSAYCDSFRAWTQIKAEKLEYSCIFSALKHGDFYASEGPEIYELWFEDGQIHILCSPADMVFCSYGTRRNGRKLSEAGKPVTEAVFTIEPNDRFFRITVVDENGKRACTNAYFAEDLFA